MKQERKNCLYKHDSIKPIERIIAAGTYLSVGLVGFVWLIIAAIFGKNVTQFLLYHIMQSIFLSIFYFLITQFLGLIFVIISKIPLFFIFIAPISFLNNLSVVQILTSLIILYLTIMSFLGYYAYLPWVSDIINKNIGRR